MSFLLLNKVLTGLYRNENG